MEENLGKIQNNFDYDYPVKSYIIRVTVDDYDFICNRNDLTIASFFKDKYVKFWEVHELYRMDSDNITDLDILETFDMTNFDKKDQAFLNTVKKKYIDLYNLNAEPDKKLSNSLFNKGLKNYRKFYKDQYKDFIDTFETGVITQDTIYEVSKLLFYSNDYNYILDLTHDEIWNMKNFDNDIKAVFILLRNWLRIRKDKGFRYPFDYGKIHETIKKLMKKYVEYYYGKKYTALCGDEDQITQIYEKIYELTEQGLELYRKWPMIDGFMDMVQIQGIISNKIY